MTSSVAICDTWCMLLHPVSLFGCVVSLCCSQIDEDCFFIASIMPIWLFCCCFDCFHKWQCFELLDIHTQATAEAERGIVLPGETKQITRKSMLQEKKKLPSWWSQERERKQGKSKQTGIQRKPFHCVQICTPIWYVSLYQGLGAFKVVDGCFCFRQWQAVPVNTVNATVTEKKYHLETLEGGKLWKYRKLCGKVQIQTDLVNQTESRIQMSTGVTFLPVCPYCCSEPSILLW